MKARAVGEEPAAFLFIKAFACMRAETCKVLSRKSAPKGPLA